MTLHDILRTKGSEIHSIGPAATLRDVVHELVHYNIGSLMVCESASKGTDVRLVGIITERDILRVQAATETPLRYLTVASVMSTDLVIASPDDQIAQAMWLMTEHRVRHLPVVAEGRLLGVISIGDVVKHQSDQLEMENFYLRSYILGEGGEVATVQYQP